MIGLYDIYLDWENNPDNKNTENPIKNMELKLHHYKLKKKDLHPKQKYLGIQNKKINDFNQPSMVLRRKIINNINCADLECTIYYNKLKPINEIYSIVSCGSEYDKNISKIIKYCHYYGIMFGLTKTNQDKNKRLKTIQSKSLFIKPNKNYNVWISPNLKIINFNFSFSNLILKNRNKSLFLFTNSNNYINNDIIIVKNDLVGNYFLTKWKESEFKDNSSEITVIDILKKFPDKIIIISFDIFKNLISY